MDALAGLLDAPRARGAFALRVVMTAPWSLRILAESPLTLLAGVTGRTWIVPDVGEPVRMDPGDIVLTRAPGHYNVADSPTTAPQVVIHPGQDCRDLNGNSQRPAHPWTMDQLAAQSGASRATLARRFNDLVGESPMTFLRNWRMALAADLLCRPGETVSSVAEKVGYATPFAFSAAFKRARGISPQEHRESARALADNIPIGAFGAR